MSILKKMKFWRVVLLLAGTFLVMFAGRMIYGYYYPGSTNNSGYLEDFFSSNDNIRRNYASEKSFKDKGGKISTADIKEASPQESPDVIPSSGQKYEKTATVKSRTSAFEQDEKCLRDKIVKFEAIIQFEQNSGNKGYRELHMSIGVNPEKFDSFYVEVLKIGKINSKVVMKTDKTNEYRLLGARKASLIKTLETLNQLSTKNGQIPDFIQLSDKIREVEEELQNLGVELGNFDQENEFCTVRISLYERRAAKVPGMIQRTKVALEWTIKYYAALMFAFGMAVFAVFILLHAIRLTRNLLSGWQKKRE